MLSAAAEAARIAAAPGGGGKRQGLPTGAPLGAPSLTTRLLACLQYGCVRWACGPGRGRSRQDRQLLRRRRRRAAAPPPPPNRRCRLHPLPTPAASPSRCSTAPSSPSTASTSPHWSRCSKSSSRWPTCMRCAPPGACSLRPCPCVARARCALLPQPGCYGCGVVGLSGAACRSLGVSPAAFPALHNALAPAPQVAPLAVFWWLYVVSGVTALRYLNVPMYRWVGGWEQPGSTVAYRTQEQQPTYGTAVPSCRRLPPTRPPTAAPHARLQRDPALHHAAGGGGGGLAVCHAPLAPLAGGAGAHGGRRRAGGPHRPHI